MREGAIRQALSWLSCPPPTDGVSLFPYRRRSHAYRPDKSPLPYRAADPRSLPQVVSDKYRVVTQASPACFVAEEVSAGGDGAPARKVLLQVR